MKQLCLVTSNKYKIQEFSDIVRPFGLQFTAQAFDIPELQGSPLDIAVKKCSEACQLYGGPVVTEDVSFIIEAWKELPGAYIKDFLRAVGPEGIVQMLQGFDNKKAYCQCIYCYAEGPGSEVVHFVGRCHGKVVPSSGKSHFGSQSFDPIFMPDGYEQTYGEMDIALKNSISHRAEASKKLAAFLRDKYGK